MLGQSGVSDGGDPANASGTDRPDGQMSCYRSFFILWNRGDENMKNVTQLALGRLFVNFRSHRNCWIRLRWIVEPGLREA